MKVWVIFLFVIESAAIFLILCIKKPEDQRTWTAMQALFGTDDLPPKQKRQAAFRRYIEDIIDLYEGIVEGEEFDEEHFRNIFSKKPRDQVIFLEDENDYVNEILFMRLCDFFTLMMACEKIKDNMPAISLYYHEEAEMMPTIEFDRHKFIDDTICLLMENE